MDNIEMYYLMVRLNQTISVIIGHVQDQSSMYQLNQFPFWTRPNQSSLTIRSSQFLSGDLSELSLITYSLLLLMFQTLMFFPSYSLVIWLEITPTILSRKLLVRPRPNVKYLRTIYQNIPGSFNYSSTFTVQLLTNYCNQSSITLSAFFVEDNKICV